MDGTKPGSEAFNQVQQFWSGLTISQRLLMVGGAVLVAGTLWLFVSLLSKPKYTVLYSGLRSDEAQELAGRLAAKNIEYQLSPDGGSLLVPADKLDSSRLETASQGLPRNARLGFELFDKPNWAGSDFTDKVNYQRALEGELERTLETLREVEAVRVHLALPPEAVYSEPEREAKAAVMIKTRGGPLSEEAQRSIPQLVASAVDRLRPENVTVMDADSNSSLVRSGAGSVSGAADFDRQLETMLLQTLEPVLGADHVRASVHAEYDLTSTEDTEETYDPKSAVAIRTQKSEERVTSNPARGVPGTASNVPGNQSSNQAAAAAAGEQQSSVSESGTYAVNKVVRHILRPAGRLQRIAAAVLVDDVIERKQEKGKTVSARRKRTPEEMKNIEVLARAAIGLDSARGDVLAVENLSFQDLPADKPVAPGAVDQARRVLLEWSGILRWLGIASLFLMVYWLLLRPVKKQLLMAFRELPSRVQKAALNSTTVAAAASLASAAPQIELPPGAEEAKRAAALKQHLLEKVKKEPAGASRLVQSWIRESNAR